MQQHFFPAARRASAIGFLTALTALMAFMAALPGSGAAHGFEGDYFFPPTIQTDDPFATDELITTIQSFKNAAVPGEPRARQVDIGTEFDKEIFPGFSLGVTETYTNLKPDANFGLASASGFQNTSLSAKYQLWESPAHQWIFSIGGEVDLGGTGSRSLGEDPFSTYTPAVYFGKAFGDLPASLRYLRPFAVTGTAGYELPSEGVAQNGLAWGLALEYSLPYLQHNVEDIGLPVPLRNLIPLVEFSMETPLNGNGGNATATTGTVSPGVLWESKYCQLGAEAVIPVNQASGHEVGCVFQVSLFIDDLLPKVFGHPLFGGEKAAASSDK